MASRLSLSMSNSILIYLYLSIIERGSYRFAFTGRTSLVGENLAMVFGVQLPLFSRLSSLSSSSKLKIFFWTMGLFWRPAIKLSSPSLRSLESLAQQLKKLLLFLFDDFLTAACSHTYEGVSCKN